MTAKEIAKLAVFEGREIRKTIHNVEWWFSVVDVVEALTDTSNATDYIEAIVNRITPGCPRIDVFQFLTRIGSRYRVYAAIHLSALNCIRIMLKF